jgi:uncharacterized protein
VSTPPLDARLQLLDWRRRIAELYAQIRAEADARCAWDAWRSTREELFLTHPQSPLPAGERDTEHAPRYFDYDPAYHVLATVGEAADSDVDVPTSHDTTSSVRRAGVARVELGGAQVALELHWLTDYAGGLLVMFRDATSGHETYGAGRYLLDTAKGADLGMDAARLVVDFNFAYQPSCSYDPAWECPLPPRANWLTVAIRAGERLR